MYNGDSNSDGARIGEHHRGLLGTGHMSDSGSISVELLYIVNDIINVL